MMTDSTDLLRHQAENCKKMVDWTSDPVINGKVWYWIQKRFNYIYT